MSSYAGRQDGQYGRSSFEEDYGQASQDSARYGPAHTVSVQGGYVPPPAPRGPPRAMPPNRQNLPSQSRTPPQYSRNPSLGPPEKSSLRGPGMPMAPRMQQPQQSQWPLAAAPSPEQRSGMKSPPRGPPPQRPPRPAQPQALPSSQGVANNRTPGNFPSIPQYPNGPQAPNPQYAHRGPGVWTEDGYGSPTYPSPNLSRPTTGSSFASTSSSYSVSDVPLPPMPQIPKNIPVPQRPKTPPGARNRPPLGPPPSARRGPASYYAQNLHVTPIVEESDSQRGSSLGGKKHDSHSSYASSNAIPIGVPDYYLKNRDTQETVDPSSEEESQAEDAVVAEREHTPTLVRQASLGKRSKPTLTTIKSNEGLREQASRPDDQDIEALPALKPLKPAETSAIVDRALGGGNNAAYSLPRSQHSNESNRPNTAQTGSSGTLGRNQGTTFFSSDSDRSVKSPLSKEYVSEEPMPQPDLSKQSGNGDPLKELIRGRLEKGGALATANEEKTPSKSEKGQGANGLASRVGSRRPMKLDVDAVREAEARGSLTSLPDLIKRATKLASNLDRGKTASRLGMTWFNDSNADNRSSAAMSEKRRSGSLSDMLNNFPSPALLTPGPLSSGRYGWPSNLRHSALPSESDGGTVHNGKKRVCGMPLWAFVLLLLLLFFLIAVAVVVPVVLLVVIPNQKHATSLATCEKKMVCENGGTSIVGQDNNCLCICSNGWSGSTCTTQLSAGCTTMSTRVSNNATVGNEVPRILSGSETNFSIPLDSSIVLGVFSAANLSCSSENALISFNDLAARSIVDQVELDLTPTKTLHARQTTAGAASSAATSAGLMFDSGSPDSSSTATGSSATSTSSSSSGSSSASSNSTLLDLARVAILFVLQDSGQLNDAIVAQENLQSYFNSPGSSNVSLSNGYTLLMDQQSISVKNGSVYGHT